MYAYDLAGRRTAVGGTFGRTSVPAAAANASYNANNQLTQWKGASLTYDANGNLTSDGVNTYTWNARNQLVAISGGASASFQYDPFGRRVSKTIGGTTQYLYDGGNPVQEISGATASANLLSGGIDEVFQRTDSAGARNFLTDALGSTVALADSTGALQTQYTFEPFSNTSVTGTATTNSFAYTGRELDATGLYFYRARYYSPQLQRFISEDPIGLRGGINQYAYVENSPSNWIDPFGMDKDKCPSVPFHLDSMDIDKNIAEEKSNAPLLPNLLGASLVLEDYYQKVRNKGPWDYKQNFNLDESGARVFPSPYEDFGNYNYGATAAALGIPESAGLRAAGYAGQRARGHSRLDSITTALGPAPFGDDAADQIQIKLGYDYYRKGCHQ
jgi:RHS repeat-associated protein